MATQIFPLPNTPPPRQSAFNAAVFIWMGFIAVFFFIGLLTFPQQMYNASLFGLTWYPIYTVLNSVIAFFALALIWVRQKWAYYLLSAQIALGSLLAISLPMSKEQALIGPIFLAALTWAMHVGGSASMWHQMFGGSLLPMFGRGFTPPPPAMPPNKNARRPVAAAASASTPAPDPMEQLRQLAALRDSGAITAQEFDAKKTEVLKRV
jgi:hypothetical protein